MSRAKQISEVLTPEPKQEKSLNHSEFLSTGLTQLDLAATGKVGAGIQKGKVYRIAGHSSSGKTFLARTILAEAANHPAFDGYDLVYDDIELGALMDTAKFFGQNLVDRLVPPARGATTKRPIYSKKLSDFYSRLMKRLEAGRSVIWIPDSMDALEADSENKMTDGKAKSNSQNLRKLLDPLEATGSIVVLISQAHVDMKSMFGGEIAAGGRALEFYSTWDIWLRKAKPIDVKKNGQRYVIGHQVMGKVKKNRLSGLDRTIFFPFYPEYGIDDIGANVSFLIRNRHWKKLDNKVVAQELSLKLPKGELIKQISNAGLEKEVQNVTAQVWNEIEASLSLERKPRYGSDTPDSN